jgi:hemoglobin
MRRFPVLAALWLAAGAAHSQEKTAKPPSLYQRLGGYDKLAAIFDDLVPRMAADPALLPFFGGHSTDTQLAQRQRLLELLCQETGGPCFYTGRPLKKAHTGLGIADAHWSSFVKYLTATLDSLKVGEKERTELLALVDRYKSDVVEKK